MSDLFAGPDVPGRGIDTGPGPDVVPRKRGGGPKTPEGKERAKANSMKHGLRATVLLPEELVAAFEAYKAELTGEFEPRTGYEGWLVREMALAMARLDRCADLSVADLQRCLDIAVFDWDDGRKTLVEDLGKKLGADPSRVAHALEQSRHGADWMIERWEGFRSVLSAVGACDDDLRRLALDLLGVPPEVRQGDFKVPPASDVAGLTALAEREVGRLRERQGRVLEDRDASRRSMAMAGMPFDEDPGTARLRRYESGIRRALSWAHAEFRRVREEAAPGRETPIAGISSPLMAPLTEAVVEYPIEHGVTPVPFTPAEETPPGAEETAAAPPAMVEVAAKATPAVKRSSDGGPMIAKVAGSFLASACTAAHRSATAPANRFEQRAAKAQARKNARHAAKGR